MAAPVAVAAGGAMAGGGGLSGLAGIMGGGGSTIGASGGGGMLSGLMGGGGGMGSGIMGKMGGMMGGGGGGKKPKQDKKAGGPTGMGSIDKGGQFIGEMNKGFAALGQTAAEEVSLGGQAMIAAGTTGGKVGASKGSQTAPGNVAQPTFQADKAPEASAPAAAPDLGNASMPTPVSNNAGGPNKDKRNKVALGMISAQN